MKSNQIKHKVAKLQNDQMELQNMNMQLMDILGEEKAGGVSRGKKMQMLDDQVSLIKNKDKRESENRFRAKGARNKNNPSNDIKYLKEVVIVKQANYMDCISCHVCIQDNVYKIYDTNFKPIYIEQDFQKEQDFDSIAPQSQSSKFKYPNIEVDGPLSPIPEEGQRENDFYRMQSSNLASNFKTQDGLNRMDSMDQSYNLRVNSGQLNRLDSNFLPQPSGSLYKGQSRSPISSFVKDQGNALDNQRNNDYFEGGRREGRSPRNQGANKSPRRSPRRGQSPDRTMPRSPTPDSLNDNEGQQGNTRGTHRNQKQKVGVKDLKQGAFFMTQLSTVKSNKIDVTYFDWNKMPDSEKDGGQRLDEEDEEDSSRDRRQSTDTEKSEKEDNRASSGLQDSTQPASSSAVTPNVMDVPKPIDLAMMGNELQMSFDEKLFEVQTDQEKLAQFMKRKQKVPLDLLNKKRRVLKIEQEGVFASNVFCPSSYRPYEAYAVSSNSIFELARIERHLECNRSLLLPEIHVYKTQYKYQDINDHFTEQLLGKIQQRFTLCGRSFFVYEISGTELILKYKISCKFFNALTDVLCPNSLKCNIRTEYKIEDQLNKGSSSIQNTYETQEQMTEYSAQKNESAGKSRVYPEKTEVTPVDDFNVGRLTLEYSHLAKQFCAKGTHYRLRFPRSANENQKTLLMTAVMMIDMAYHDKKCCLPLFPC